MPTDHESRQRHLILNTILVSGSFLLAAGMGLLRNRIIARQFGLTADLDAFFAAFKLPDLLFTIVAGGALATAFIPVFAQHLTNEGDRSNAWRLTSAVTNLVCVVVTILSMIAAIFAPWLVRTIIAPGFEASQQAETVAVMRIVLVSTLFFGISAVQSSALHGFRHFLTPALAPIFYPVGVIIGALFLAPEWGIRGLAIGAVIGAFLHLAVKLPMLLHFGFRWQPILDLRSPDLRRILSLMGPRVLDLGVFQLTLIMSTNLASRLGSGSVGALEWGWEFMQLPETVIGTAFGLVVFPTLAQLAAQEDRDSLRQTLDDSLRLLLALTVPAACGLIILGLPLINLVYQGGAFDAEAGQAVNLTLRYYALGLVGHVCLEVVARVFFAQQDTITPLIVAGGAALLQLGIALGLMGPLGTGGIALANSIAITVEVLVLIFLLHRRMDGINSMPIALYLLRVLLSGAIMSAGVIWVTSFTTAQEYPTIFVLALGGFSGLLLYGIVGFLLRVWHPADLRKIVPL